MKFHALVRERNMAKLVGHLALVGYNCPPDHSVKGNLYFDGLESHSCW